MLVRIVFVAAASAAAFAVQKGKRHKRPVKPPGHDETVPNTGTAKEFDKERNEHSSIIQWENQAEEEEEEEEKEEEEEVKTISNFIATSTKDDEELLPEFESLLSGEIDFPLPDSAYDDYKATSQYDIEIANYASEVERLRTLVKELEDREVKLEGELLEYYGLEEQESDFTELHKQLKLKTAEVDMLNITINSMQAERKKLQEEVAPGVAARKELEVARNKIKELQRQIQLDSGQTKGQLLLLKQQVSLLHVKEEEAARKDAELERKLKGIRELELEVVELRRKSKELQHEKRELTAKLADAEKKVNELTTMTENEMITSAREEINKLRHANDDLTKQVEGLQMNRFSEVEELVYLRWVNACLRYELRNYENASGKISAARDLNKNLSPKSQERAKRLMLEYAGSERGQGDTDLESISSMPSSPGGSEDFDNASLESYSSRFSSVSKKPSIIQKLKKWGKGKDHDGSVTASPSRSFGGSQRSVKGPLEILMLRNVGDHNAITTFGARSSNANENELVEEMNLPRLKTRVASTDSLNSVSSSFQLMSKSVEGTADEKYPAFKDRHKLALEREKAIKEKAEQARAERFSEGTVNSNVNVNKNVSLPPKLTQIKEKKPSGLMMVKSAAASNSGELVGTGDNSKAESQAMSKIKLAEIEKRPPRVPRPPPKESAETEENKEKSNIGFKGVPPPPPPPGKGGPPPPPPPPVGGPPRPPPPPGSMGKGSGGGSGVHRAPELVELYQSLMKRESKKEPTSLASVASNAIADARSNMIGEIANKSTFMLAVKADVETQGDFVNSLAAEVRAASFTKIEHLVSFVNWLDEELSFLVDERAVLKHFDWPEGKADALREAAFEYQDLEKLEKRVSSFVDDPQVTCEAALKKMYSLLEKMEESVYALLRTRDMAMSRYKEFGIPVDWLSDSGIVGKIKLSSVQLARKYMKRVSSELDSLNGTDKEPNREFLLLQGVRFAFRVHQFAGGFDADSMRAFEELRNRANSQSQTTEQAAKNEI